MKMKGIKMSEKIGFIGCGNMGKALSSAVSKVIDGKQILLSNRSPEKAEFVSKNTGGIVCSNEDIAKNANYIFLCVKPQQMEGLLYSLRDFLKERTDRFVLITVAAGIKTARICEMADLSCPVIRIMPNTPVSIGKGMIQYTVNPSVTAEEKEFFQKIMQYSGLIDEIPENLIDASSAISGCGPAFADMFMAALADGGVEIGLPRDKAIKYAAQMLLGSAQLLLETGEHPEKLKDDVCSPGGSTIVGVHALEAGAFRSTVINAVVGSFNKNKDLGKN